MVVDANGGWLAHEAVRVVRAVRGLDITIEQPCATYEACLAVRRHTDLPMILDEVIDSVPALLRAHADGAMDAINLKLSKVGGLTRARQMRDLCVALGVPMTIEGSGGGDVIGTAVAHLAQAIPPSRHPGNRACGYPGSSQRPTKPRHQPPARCSWIPGSRCRAPRNDV